LATYEIVVVLRPDLEEDAIAAAVGRIHQRITEHGGSVTSTDRWGKRRLAYAIQKHRDGYYALSVFTLEPTKIAPLRQNLGLQEDLLRFVVAEHHAAPPRPVAPAQPAAAQPAAPAGGAPAPTAGGEPAAAPRTEPAAAVPPAAGAAPGGRAAGENSGV
jgi:small subunit ribosomal protein S6